MENSIHAVQMCHTILSWYATCHLTIFFSLLAFFFVCRVLAPLLPLEYSYARSQQTYKLNVPTGELQQRRVPEEEISGGLHDWNFIFIRTSCYNAWGSISCHSAWNSTYRRNKIFCRLAAQVVVLQGACLNQRFIVVVQPLILDESCRALHYVSKCIKVWL